MASVGAIARKPVSQFVLLALALEIPLVRMRVLSDLRHHIITTIAILLAASLVYIVSTWCILRREAEGREIPPLALILFAAVVFRLTVFPLYPAFSEDLYRYRWEGKMQAAGFNPYLTRPDDARLSELRDSVYPRIVGKEFRGIYGPLLELQERWFYAAIARLTPDAASQLFWFKAVAALADVGIIGAVCLFLRARDLPLERVLIYAWCPLPIFEFWATGHNDAVVLFFMMLALALAARGEDSIAYLALSLAVAAKYWPALLFPLFTRYRWRRMLLAGVVLAATGAVLSFPYRADVRSNARFTTGFLGGWRNNDSLHGAIAWIAGDPYRAKYISMALLAAAALGIAGLRWRLEARALALIVTILALSANVHPWYVTWIVPLLALYPIPGLLLWTALVPLTYGVLIDFTILGAWNGNTALRWLVYAPVALVLAFRMLLPPRLRTPPSPTILLPR